ncbi:MAG TPA: metalloregulator ArsR/SmtB family transcription factor [Thermodesulfobacteriota bacterium]
MSPNADVARYAAMFAALGHAARLEIVRLLLAAHPVGMVAGEIQQELGIPASTLSHHLDALRQVGLVEQRREGKYQRYLAAADGLAALLRFLYAECCTRSQVVSLSALRRTSS